MPLKSLPNVQWVQEVFWATNDHPEEQITIIHSGHIRFTVDGEVVEMRTGDVAVIPGGVPHGAVVIGGQFQGARLASAATAMLVL